MSAFRWRQPEGNFMPPSLPHALVKPFSAMLVAAALAIPSLAFAGKAYLSSELFNKDVVTELKPLLKDSPEVRIYSAN
jgi:hypothetical protein